MRAPRLIVAALRGGSGKTILSLGIIAALQQLGYRVAPFKKGPDYIDAGWLALAAGRPCYNLDSFLLSAGCILDSFRSHSRDVDISVIEGNRGLYDGIDLEGSTSTAELAKLLQAPVLLCVDCTKTTRTMAAVISGCRQFDPAVPLKGVILNRVAGSRHEKILRNCIEQFCGLPVIGAVPKLERQIFPERHMGLVPTPEHDWAVDSIDQIGRTAVKYLNLDQIAAIAQTAPGLQTIGGTASDERSCLEITAASLKQATPERAARPRIGVLRDSAFQFYYLENLESLAAAGAELVETSPLRDRHLPELDGLYIGGGFPETHAAELADNRDFAEQLKLAIEDGLPVYAECGGLMYLGKELVLEEIAYPMTGVLPVVFGFYKRPQGHGYTVATVEKENPFYEVGTEIKGHEFHYSRVIDWDGDKRDLVFRMQRGVGITADRDGTVYKNVLATYIHVHALGTPAWVSAMVQNAANHQARKHS
jgi:cobyrinic acid a,c-diamide synthase